MLVETCKFIQATFTMALAKDHLWTSVEDYLRGEEYSEIRHEYISGELHAMEGRSSNHNRICLAIATFLTQKLAPLPVKYLWKI